MVQAQDNEGLPNAEDVVARYREVCRRSDQLNVERAALLRQGVLLLRRQGFKLPAIAERLQVSRQRLHQVLWEQRARQAQELWGGRAAGTVRLVEAAAALGTTVRSLQVALEGCDVAYTDEVATRDLVNALAARLRYPPSLSAASNAAQAA